MTSSNPQQKAAKRHDILRIVIAGGGTGGHVYPAVAVAEEVLRRHPNAEVTFVGSDKGLENTILPPLGHTLKTVTVSRLKGGGVWERIKGLLRLPVGIFQSWLLLRKAKPQVVLGVGGYASGPVLLAAWMTWRRIAVQEQNAVPGMTNKFLGRVAHGVYVGFGAAAQHFSKPERVIVTGNPLRRSVAKALDGQPRQVGESGALRILVFGGSQGARFLNENVPAAVAALASKRPDLRLSVLHQTGVADETGTRQRYSDGPAEVDVVPYIDDMPATYANTDVAICRAGALTVAELTAVGLPAFMVPFPYAADNHQVGNAAELVQAGAGAMMEQNVWKNAKLVNWLEAAADDAALRASMSQKAYALARVDAASAVVSALECIAKPAGRLSQYNGNDSTSQGVTP